MSISSPDAQSASTGLAGRVVRLLSVARLKPFDTSTSAGRSMERYRRAALTAITAAGAKAVSIATALITVPLTLRYLGTERYGLWLTMSSVIVMAGFADFGIGNGLLNVLSAANGRDDRDAAREAVSSATFMLLVVAVVIALAFAVSYLVVPWASVFNVDTALAAREAGPAMAVLIGCFVVNVPLDVVQRVQLGYQKGFVNYMWQAAGSLIALAAVIVAIELRAGLPWLVLGLAGGPVLATFMNGVVEFGWVRPWLLPAWKRATRRTARVILNLGVMFLVLQLAVTIAFASDNIVIAQVLGAEAVPEYAVPMRLFALIGVVISMLVGPLWPAYGEAMSRGDFGWVRRTLLRSMAMALVVAGLPSIILVIFGQQILTMWVGNSIDPSLALLLGLGTWTVLSALGTTLAMFLNGANIVKFQAICATIMAAVALVLKLKFAHHFGVAGVVWAVVLAYTLCIVVPMIVYVPRLLRRMGDAAGLRSASDETDAA